MKNLIEPSWKICPYCHNKNEKNDNQGTTSHKTFCSGSGRPIVPEDRCFSCSHCQRVFLEEYRFKDKPICGQCAYASGVAQQCEEELEARLRQEIAWAIKRELLVSAIEDHLCRIQLEQANQELAKLKHHLLDQQKAITKDNDYRRLQATLKKAREHAKQKELTARLKKQALKEVREQTRQKEQAARIKKESVWQSRRENLITTIEGCVNQIQLEQAQKELVKLGRHLDKQKARTKDKDYKRLQSTLKKAKEISKPHTCKVTGMKFIFVPGGEFMMGDTWGDGSREELPTHRVNIRHFKLGKYPVTQGQWLSIMGGENPAQNEDFRFIGRSKPIINVSWDEAQEFIRRLNSITGNRFSYRLPSEAEWEYAARSGGRQDKWSRRSTRFGLFTYVHYGQDWKEGSTIIVGKKRPNGLDLYDMSGNVCEWCEDIWHKNYHGAPTNGSP